MARVQPCPHITIFVHGVYKGQGTLGWQSGEDGHTDMGGEGGFGGKSGQGNHGGEGDQVKKPLNKK